MDFVAHSYHKPFIGHGYERVDKSELRWLLRIARAAVEWREAATSLTASELENIDPRPISTRSGPALRLIAAVDDKC